MASEVLRALSVAGLTVALVFAALTVLGVVLLARRRRRRAVSPDAAHSLELDAGSALLRLDDAVAAGADEVAFAAAQFGADRVRPFAEALAAARDDLAEAFGLKRRIEDATTESDFRRREWNRRITTLCERSLRLLEEHSREFSALRAAEAEVPERLRRARLRVGELTARLDERRRAAEGLSVRFEPSAVSGVHASITAADDELTRAQSMLSAAESGLGAAVTAVGDSVSDAERSLQRVSGLLDTAENAEQNLRQATAELEQVTSRARAELEEARGRRSTAPDADAADAITGAVAGVEEVLAAVASGEVRTDPIRAIDRVQVSLARLDTALAAARNQEQRLRSAREALEGALFSARSQISTARGALAEHGRSAGTGARVRLTEAERELELALNAADPLEALDAARRAATHARDADALARYRG